MISSAGQLGIGALARPGDTASAATLEVRTPSELPNPKVLRFAHGTKWSHRRQVAVRPRAELGSNVAGNISVPTVGSEGIERFADMGWYGHQHTVATRVDMIGSLESRNEDWFAGSFALKTTVRPAAEPDVIVQVHARGAEAAEQIADAAPTPYVSVIWALVEEQQLRKARALLQLIPDSPEFMKLKRLLSAPIAKASQRKDFDRSREYRWLADHARNHVGKWVAVSGDSLIATANTLKELREEIKKTALARSPLLHYVE